MWKQTLLSVVFLLLFVSADAPGNRLLVLLDDLFIEDSHSIFFENLKEFGFEYEIGHLATNFTLGAYGEFFYDGLLILGNNFDLKGISKRNRTTAQLTGFSMEKAHFFRHGVEFY